MSQEVRGSIDCAHTNARQPHAPFGEERRESRADGAVVDQGAVDNVRGQAHHNRRPRLGDAIARVHVVNHARRHKRKAP